MADKIIITEDGKIFTNNGKALTLPEEESGGGVRLYKHNVLIFMNEVDFYETQSPIYNVRFEIVFISQSSEPMDSPQPNFNDFLVLFPSQDIVFYFDTLEMELHFMPVALKGNSVYGLTEYGSVGALDYSKMEILDDTVTEL